MFRKKEDSLFDNTVDTNAAPAPAESVTVVAPQPAVSLQQPGATGTQFSPQTPMRSFPESRQQTTTPATTAAATAQATSSFRPAAPQQAAPIGDLTRNRIPETKTPTLPASLNPSNKSGRRVLTVGHEILLKGEIATCDRLVIEGRVDATLNDVHTVEISEAGSFKGSANIEDAEISGLFEGDLTVRNCLVIRSTGKVRGKISFGEVEIERGGELTGEIKIAGVQAGARPVRPATPTKESVAA